MKVILKSSLNTIGEAGDIVDVNDGYARNFLFPKDMAAPATSFNVKSLNHQKLQIERRVQREQTAALAVSERLKTVTVTIRCQVGEEDKMFGSVTSRDISDALRKEGIDMDHRTILISGPIKELGVHDIEVKLSHGVKGSFKLLVDRA
ncbi:MAG: 50S ribosomal protein L9 [Myxococcales bacterium]|nr:50S ribosomal protein L9 [Myxococcales bacterium]|tara:strand:+ start:1764 stop:2207 length:444 start_codon:yes stop_codon:yes gene_type:complete